MNAIIRQLAAEGWSDEAIASATRLSVEQVALALGRGGSEPESPACLHAPVSLRSAAQQRPAPLRAPEHQRPRTPEEIGRSVIERLAKQRAQLQADAAVLRAEIERLMEADHGPAWGRAKRIQPKLSRPASLRTVQSHLTEIARSRRHCASE